ncbi:hypothetical protein P280DRAFT_405147 [Massarina eburnea CBS 473.64]|uniref:F-box domain-containing protein n=1 Tax=Massarina eburnea CBS 473.64 TaxID=1395130 RepID=A0A6A6RSC9_9PLEO|nr:hypothetical protein P280DRAFT_405147 [Massarina eburnea CBS 473.64]
MGQTHHPNQNMELKSIPLPLELVLHVITCLLPKTGYFLPRSHPVTKTLLSFTMVCFETYLLARRYLREYCAYICSPFHLGSILLSIPCSPGNQLRNIRSLYLAPFKTTIDDLPVALWMRELLFYTSSTLKRLVIDIPLGSVRAEEDRLDVRRVLRDGFARLNQLEEFVSVQDDLSLDLVWTSEKNFVWRQWPKLKRLALHDANLSRQFWNNIGESASLEMLVLVRPNSLRDTLGMVENSGLFSEGRSLRLLLVDAGNNAFPDIATSRRNEARCKKESQIVRHDLGFSFNDINAGKMCQEWVKARCVDNTLWSFNC